jgi:hypothetical protein
MDQGLVACRHQEIVHSCTTASVHLADPGPSSHAGAVAAPAGKRSRAAWLWGAGSAVLSGLGFVALALFEQYNGMIGELRNDLKHFNETQGNFVKREYFEKFREKSREGFRELREIKAERAQLEQELKTSQKARAELAKELQHLRERLAFVEGRQTTLPRAEPAAHEDH